MIGLSERIQEAKTRVDIPTLWALLQLPGEPPRNGVGVCKSPLRADNHPSFSIHEDGTRWKDHGSGEGGDAIDFVEAAEGRGRRDAALRFLELAGMPSGQAVTDSRPRRDTPENPDVSGFRRPTDEEVELIARSRKLDPDAVQRAANFRILRTGEYKGFPVWALVDGPRGYVPRVAEVRRLDGGRIPTADNPEGVKGITIRGSHKDWPIGASLLDMPGKWSAVLLVEGMPDFLAAFHFAHLAGRPDLCPVAVLGRSNKRLHSVALDLMSGMTVRSFPHADADGGGRLAMEGWAAQIPNGEADAFDFTGLRRRDGKPVNDLNDAAVIHPEDQHELEELLPA